MIHMAGEIYPKPTSLCSHRFQCSLSALEQLVFAPWRIGEHGQAAPLWRDEDETPPNSLLSCLKPCRLLEDFLEDVSTILDRAGKLSLPKKVGISGPPPLRAEHPLQKIPGVFPPRITSDSTQDTHDTPSPCPSMSSSHHTSIPGMLNPSAAVGNARGASRTLMDKQENQGYSYSFFPSLLIFYAGCPIISQAGSAPRCLSAVAWKEA